MTKTEILAELAARRAVGFVRRGRQVDDWESGYRVAEEVIRRCMVTPCDVEVEPVAAVLDALGEADVVYRPNLEAHEVCGPFNPARALDARRM